MVTTSYSAVGLSPATSYSFTVSAIDAAGSAWSGMAGGGSAQHEGGGTAGGADHSGSGDLGNEGDEPDDFSDEEETGDD